MRSESGPEQGVTRPYAEQWVAERFLGEAPEEGESVAHLWFQAYTPFREGQELEETYGPEAKDEMHATELEDQESYGTLYEATDETPETQRERPEEEHASSWGAHTDLLCSTEREQQIEPAEPEYSYEDRYSATETFEQSFPESEKAEFLTEEHARPGDVEAREPDQVSELYQEWPAKDEDHTLAHQAEARRLQQAYFDSFVREAKAILDNTAEEVKHRAPMDMEEAEIEVVLDRYRPVEILLPQGMPFYLMKVREAAKGVLARLQTSTIEERPVSRKPSANPATDLEQEMPTSSGGLGSFTSSEEKALRITNAFENTTFYSQKRDLDYGGLSGDFDGQGLSFGLLQWNIGTGSLQPLLKEFAQGYSQRFDTVFQTDAARLRQVLSLPRREQLAWARSINDYSKPRKPRIKEPWVGYFRQLAQEPTFRQIQLRHVRPRMNIAADYVRRLRLRSERALAFLFDIIVQHGGGWLDSRHCHGCGTQTRRARIEQHRAELERQVGTPSEKQLLQLIASVIAETIGPQWRQDVLRRRMTIVDGQGTVHGHRFDLAHDFGLTDKPLEEATLNARTPPTARPEAPPAPPSTLTTRRTLSGAHWVARFPSSKDVKDLESTFRPKVEQFIRAIEDAGGSVTVTSTYRPPERAYLMRYSWEIVKKDFSAQNVPLKAGVNIEWWHGDATKSKQAAQEMVNAYGIQHLEVPPALRSRHIEGKAIDMKITWRGNLKIKNADGTERIISSSPRNETNAELIQVGKTYGVIHFTDVDKDRVHWSTDGR